VDDLDPAVVIARVLQAPSATCPADTCAGTPRDLVTRDGGSTWAAVPGTYPRLADPGPYPELRQFATRAGVTYALFRESPQSMGSGKADLAVSTDGLRTWAVRRGAFAAITRFWLNRFTGAILAQAQSGGFWQTANAGQVWTGFAGNNPFDFSPDSLVAQTPYANQPWQACGTNPAPDDNQGNPNLHTDDLACATAAGAGWMVRHIPALHTYAPTAIADDGSLLLEEVGQEQQGGPAPASFSFFRLPPGSVMPEALGTLPPAALIEYVAGNGAGVLWGLPSYPGGLGGGTLDQGQVFTAGYA
jgi:hypothetical protein